MGYAFTGKAVDLGYGRGWMDEPAALSQFRIDAELGHPQQITEAGRDYEQQMRFWLMYQAGTGSIALHPDTPSIHQKGRAKDTNERLADVRFRHGWRLTVYRWVNGVYVLVEPWHEEYSPELDLYYGTTSSPADTGNSTDLSLEDFMSASQFHYGEPAPDGSPRGAVFLTPLGAYIPRSNPVTKDVPYPDEEARVLKKYYGPDQPKTTTDIPAREYDLLVQAHANIVDEFIARVKGEPVVVPPVVVPPVVVPPKA